MRLSRSARKAALIGVIRVTLRPRPPVAAEPLSLTCGLQSTAKLPRPRRIIAGEPRSRAFITISRAAAPRGGAGRGRGASQVGVLFLLKHTGAGNSRRGISLGCYRGPPGPALSQPKLHTVIQARGVPPPRLCRQQWPLAAGCQRRVSTWPSPTTKNRPS